MKVFIGHDSRQDINTEACTASLKRFGHQVFLIDIDEMKQYGYERDEDGSTEFTYTRFLVPFLCDYKGYALFCDSDFIWKQYPALLLDIINEGDAVSVVKHDIKNVRKGHKFCNNKNEWYPKKWWSSLMYFNCAHPSCKKLTVDAVNTLSPADLHRFEWVTSPFSIGEIPKEFNYLVGYYDTGTPIGLHFTDGSPMHKDYVQDPYAEDWYEFASRTV